ncbi:hypothetical protein EVAR_84627_1 [Eumeta japonica]|uniref:Uncharacterized protein n=1 Tax=Eumeta variegata TaxID=151549 RepID=A0A4C1UYH3_EUMVA|nr:hypothetical protein EVAR_84627_1 [Eumeta japonica]
MEVGCRARYPTHIRSETGVRWDMGWRIRAEYFVPVVLGVLQQNVGVWSSKIVWILEEQKQEAVRQLQSSMDDIPPHEYRSISVYDTLRGNFVATIHEEIGQPEFLSRSEFSLAQEDNTYVLLLDESSQVLRLPRDATGFPAHNS